MLEFLTMRKLTVYLYPLLLLCLAPTFNAQDAPRMPLVRLTADAAHQLNRDSLASYSATYFDEAAWRSGLTDSIFGPLLHAQDPAPGRSAACILSPEFNDAICLFFQDSTPYGYLTLEVKPGLDFTAAGAKAAYAPVTPTIIGTHSFTYQFEAGNISLDDGTALTSYLVVKESKL